MSEANDRSDGEAAGGDDASERDSGAPRAGGSAPATGGRKIDPVKPVYRVTPAQWVFLFVVAFATAGLDLWSKSWAVRTLSSPNPNPPPVCTPVPGRLPYQREDTRTVVVLRNYADFRYAENCGGAWGLLHGTREGLRKPFFLIVTIGAVFFILHLYRSLEAGQRAMRWALPLVLGGAIGNLVDRIRLGYVVDFIHMHWQGRHHWPTYNVADIAITVGIGLMLLEYILGPKKVDAKAKPRPAPG